MKIFDYRITVDNPILIVDDNPADRELYRQLLLQDDGNESEVLVAESCEQAFDILQEKTPSCCVVDYQLPVKNGLDFLKEIRQHDQGKSVPVVIITGEGDERIAVDIMRNGAQDYIVKGDITREHLLRSINGAINSCEMQNRLSYLAHYDVLTGLLNRSLFLDRVQVAMDKSDRYKHGCALLYIDVDNFKTINDHYGHQVGDAVLQEIGKRLKANCRITDSPARLGGDEFSVLLDYIEEDQAVKTADKIVKAAEEPVRFEGNKIHVSLSIGVSYYPKTATTVAELIKQADEAMYCAKQAGKSGFVHFSEKLQDESDRRRQLENLLPAAIKHGELDLVYQPIVNSSDHSLHSFEVLARWNPDGFKIPASELIEMIESLNLFDDFHDWLIATAFSQCAQWQATEGEVNVCLNIPASHAHSEWLLHCLQRAFSLYDVKPPQISLEITESTLMSDPDESNKMLSRMQDEGVKIAIDDFGTSYSSMAYLTTLPLNIIKIDQRFIQYMDTDLRNRKIVEGITALAHSLELQVVAEGIETEAQCIMAKEIGCDLLQGFYIGHPAKLTHNDQFVDTSFLLQGRAVRTSAS